ncbi:uncharacterized protein LOC142352042 isoform X3 [Convolutriloba macropyga]|uniref:uncharacterized protein LOC142352042 isoform X3 n=1 Tax=Convolutriloba macropyga TaxID=536237 RepID=UPI003F52006D
MWRRQISYQKAVRNNLVDLNSTTGKLCSKTSLCTNNSQSKLGNSPTAKQNFVHKCEQGFDTTIESNAMSGPGSSKLPDSKAISPEKELANRCYQNYNMVNNYTPQSKTHQGSTPRDNNPNNKDSHYAHDDNKNPANRSSDQEGIGAASGHPASQYSGFQQVPGTQQSSDSNRSQQGSLKARRGQSPNQLSPHTIKRRGSGSRVDDGGSGSGGGYSKKGWLLLWHAGSKEWSKHWFVLRGFQLLYYQNIEAEEDGKPDGSVNLSTCKNVKEYPIEKNSGFRIYTHEGAVQLAALTDNIRLGWIQAVADLILKQEEHEMAAVSNASRRARVPAKHPKQTNQVGQQVTSRSVPPNAISGGGSLRQKGRQSPSPTRSPNARRGAVNEATAAKAPTDQIQPKPKLSVGSSLGTSSLASNDRHPSSSPLFSKSRGGSNTDASYQSRDPTTQGHPESETEFNNNNTNYNTLPRNRDKTTSVPLAQLDTTTTTSASFQISSGAEEQGQAAPDRGQQSGDRGNQIRLGISTLRRDSSSTSAENRPIRLSPREEEVLRLRAQVKNLTAVTKDQECQITFLKNSSLSLSNKLKEVKKEDNSTQTTQTGKSEQPSEKTDKKLQEEIKDLRNCKECLLKKVEVLSLARSEQLTEIAQLQEKLEESQKALRNAQSHNRSPVGRLRGDKFQVYQKTNDNYNFDQAEQSSESDNNNDLLKKVEKLTTQLNETKNRNNQLNRKLEIETEKSSVLERNVKRLKGELESSQKSYNHLKEELCSSEQKVKELQSEANRKVLASRRGRDMSENSYSDQQMNLNKRSISCNDENHKDIAAKLVASEQSLKILQESYDEESKRSENEVTKLKQELSVMENLYDKLKSDNQKMDNGGKSTNITSDEKSQKLSEALETIELMERKQAIEKLRVKKAFKQLNDSQAKLIRENAKFARNFEKLDKDLQEKEETMKSLEQENEKLGRQKKDLEHFMEKRLKESKDVNFPKRTNLSEKGVLVALPTSYEQSLELQIVDLKNSFENEKEFFKRIGEIFPNLGLFSNTEIKRIFREKLTELKNLRDRAKVLERQILKWDNPRDTPQGCVNEFVVTAYQLAAVEYTCGLLKRQIDSGSDLGDVGKSGETRGDEEITKKMPVALVRWSSSELNKQLMSLDDKPDLLLSKLPQITQNLITKCQTALEHLHSTVDNPQGQKDCKLYCVEFLHELIRDLRCERKLFSDAVNQSVTSAQFAESLTADILHIVSSSKESFSELAELVDKQVQNKQKQLPINDLVTRSISNLEVSLDAISNDTSSSAVPQLRDAIANITQSLNSLFSAIKPENLNDGKGANNSEHSNSAKKQAAPAQNRTGGTPASSDLSSPATGEITDNCDHQILNSPVQILCQKLIKCAEPKDICTNVEPNTKAELNTVKGNLVGTTIENVSLFGGSDYLVSASHWLVSVAIASANQNKGKRDIGSDVNWSDVHAFAADIESELDRGIESHLEMIEGFAKLLTENHDETLPVYCKEIFELAERLTRIFESHRLKHSQCMSTLLDKLSSLNGHQKTFSHVSQLLSGSSDLRNAGSYQKWLDVEIDNSVLRLENYDMQKLLHKSLRTIENYEKVAHSKKENSHFVEELKGWCENHPLEGGTDLSCQIFLHPDVENSKVVQSTSLGEIKSYAHNSKSNFCSNSKLTDDGGLLAANNAYNQSGYDEAASLIHYIIVKAFICSSVANTNAGNISHLDGTGFQVTLLPSPITSLEYTSFSSLILTAAIYLNQLQSLLSRLGKNFPKELKILRSHIKNTAGQNIDNISKQHESAEKFLSVLSNSEIASTLQKIADGYTKQFKRQRDKYANAVLKLQKLKNSPSENNSGFVCSKCASNGEKMKRDVNGSPNDKRQEKGAVNRVDLKLSPMALTVSNNSNSPTTEQLREDLMRTLESVNSYSQYVSKLLHPDVVFNSQENNLNTEAEAQDEMDSGGREIGGRVGDLDPFSESHNDLIAMKLNTLEKQWKRLSDNIQNNVNVKTTACCEEVFRGAFDIGLLILFAHRVGLPIHEPVFANKFSDELQAIKELYDEAIGRTVVKCESVVNRYNDLCEREVHRLNSIFNTVIQTHQQHKELAEMRLNSNVKIETILSQISVLHFDPQLVHNLKTAYEEQSGLVDEEIRLLSAQVKSRSLESATLEQNLEEALEEVEILRSHTAMLEEQLNTRDQNINMTSPDMTS